MKDDRKPRIKKGTRVYVKCTGDYGTVKDVIDNGVKIIFDDGFSCIIDDQDELEVIPQKRRDKIRTVYQRISGFVLSEPFVLAAVIANLIVSISALIVLFYLISKL